jgi:hypothetical protein
MMCLRWHGYLPGILAGGPALRPDGMPMESLAEAMGSGLQPYQQLTVGPPRVRI